MKRILIATLVAGAFTHAAASDEEAVVVMKNELMMLADAGGTAMDWQKWAEDFTHDLHSSMGAMFGHRLGSSRVVKGAPYSAEVITESNQHLADGNVISKKTSGHVYRDGEGRTRQETLRAGKDPVVYITDPVSGTSIILSPDKKRATSTPKSYRTYTERSKNSQRINIGGTDVRIEDGRVYLNGKEVPDGKAELKSRTGKDVKIENGKIYMDGKELLVGSDRNVAIRQVQSSDGSTREEVRVQVVRGGETTEITVPVPPVPPVPPIAPVPPMPPLPGAFGFQYDTSRLGKGVTTAMGMKDFDGVKAEGKSTVWTIPAGQVGNRNPINVTSESWYSPDLKLTVYSRYSDPRRGETIYRLAGLKRSEPAPDLFKVPADYEVRGRGKAPEAK